MKIRVKREIIRRDVDYCDIEVPEWIANIEDEDERNEEAEEWASDNWTDECEEWSRHPYDFHYDEGIEFTTELEEEVA